MKFSFFLFAALIFTAAGAQATPPSDRAAVSCTHVVNITKAHGVLYKDENVHGGRGLTALYQNTSERTGTTKVQLRTVHGCALIGTLGLFKCDEPYGCRYYAAYGSNPTKAQIIKKTRKDGSKFFLMQGAKNKWWKIRATSSRAGQVNKPQ